MLHHRVTFPDCEDDLEVLDHAVLDQEPRVVPSHRLYSLSPCVRAVIEAHARSISLVTQNPDSMCCEESLNEHREALQDSVPVWGSRISQERRGYL